MIKYYRSKLYDHLRDESLDANQINVDLNYFCFHSFLIESRVNHKFSICHLPSHSICDMSQFNNTIMKLPKKQNIQVLIKLDIDLSFKGSKL